MQGARPARAAPYGILSGEDQGPMTDITIRQAARVSDQRMGYLVLAKQGRRGRPDQENRAPECT